MDTVKNYIDPESAIDIMRQICHDKTLLDTVTHAIEKFIPCEVIVEPDSDIVCCGDCGIEIPVKYDEVFNFCPQCGKKIKWLYRKEER